MTPAAAGLLDRAWAHHPDCLAYFQGEGTTDPALCNCALDQAILAIEREAAAAAIERVQGALAIGPCHECSNAEEIYRALDAEAAR